MIVRAISAVISVYCVIAGQERNRKSDQREEREKDACVKETDLERSKSETVQSVILFTVTISTAMCLCDSCLSGDRYSVPVGNLIL